MQISWNFRENYQIWVAVFKTPVEKPKQMFISRQEKIRGQRGKLPVQPLGYVNCTKVIYRGALERKSVFRYLPSSSWKLQQQTKLIQASPLFFGVPKQRPETACSFVASPMTGYKDKKHSLIGQVSTSELGANWFLKMKPRPWLAYFMKGMLFGCEQPFLWGSVAWHPKKRLRRRLLPSRLLPIVLA